MLRFLSTQCGERRVAAGQPGFTLIEVLVTTMLSALLLLGATSLFTVFMVNSLNTNIRRQVSAEGQQIAGTLEFYLRNAAWADCTGGSGIGSKVVLTRHDGTKSAICADASSKILFNPSGNTCATATDALHSAQTSLTSYGLTCTTDGSGKKIVTINFTLSNSNGSTTFNTPFSLSVVLRNS